MAVAFHVNSTRAMACMGIQSAGRSQILDSAVIDTGSSKLSTIGNELTNGAQAASVLPTKPKYGGSKYRIGGVGAHVETLGMLKFSFLFGGQI